MEIKNVLVIDFKEFFSDTSKFTWNTTILFLRIRTRILTKMVRIRVRLSQSDPDLLHFGSGAASP